jgi:hypothetical protein
MNLRDTAPRLMGRAAIIVVIVMAIALIGGVWVAGAQTNPEEPPTGASVVTTDATVAEGQCLLFAPGEEGYKGVNYESCEPPISVVCLDGAAFEQFVSVANHVIVFVYAGPGNPPGNDFCAIVAGAAPEEFLRGGISQ